MEQNIQIITSIAKMWLTANCILKLNGLWLFFQQIILLLTFSCKHRHKHTFYNICTFYVFTILYNAGIVSETSLFVSPCMHENTYAFSKYLSIWIFMMRDSLPLHSNACSLNQSKTHQHHITKASCASSELLMWRRKWSHRI